MKIKRVHLLTPILVFLLLLTACAGVEDPENLLIGTWKHINYQTGDWEKITFNEDKTYRLENYDGATYQTSVLAGNYTFDEERFVIKQRFSYDIAYYYTISGDNLYFGGLIYVRQ
ncbi:MAG: hypothetical protein JXR21_06515 [Candidatus Marinimicrobia bacterium]|nr:hypothetical protein [Candidatus Neomarinimicrobiota bacterium]